MESPEVLLSVVIPYFQREPGILRKAVESALRQEGFDDFDIIVVDDSSPVRATDDIGDLVAAHADRIRIIERPNGGPGAARNTALDSLPPTRRYVAFLDSDDEWEPHHLATAVAVLERGFDFYFANLYHLDRNVSTFDREEQIRFPSRLRPEEMRALDGLPQCFEYCGDMFDRVLFSGNKILPTTVVYRFDKFSAARYREEYRCMGEDYLFFAGVASEGARFAFSWRPAARRGHGVNVFDKSGWGTPQHLRRLCDELSYRKYAARTWKLTEQQRIRAKEKLWSIRSDFATAALGHLRRGELAPLREVLRICRLDPAYPLLVPFLLVKSVLSRMSEEHAPQAEEARG